MSLKWRILRADGSKVPATTISAETADQAMEVWGSKVKQDSAWLRQRGYTAEQLPTEESTPTGLVNKLLEGEETARPRKKITGWEEHTDEEVLAELRKFHELAKSSANCDAKPELRHWTAAVADAKAEMKRRAIKAGNPDVLGLKYYGTSTQ